MLHPLALSLLVLAPEPAGASFAWRDEVLSVPYAAPAMPTAAVLDVARHDILELKTGRSVVDTPPRIGERSFDRVLGTHAPSILRVFSPDPTARFSAWVGVDNNDGAAVGTVVFVVSAEGRELYRSGVLRHGEQPVRADVEMGGARLIELGVEDGGDGVACDHADWADPILTTVDGAEIGLDVLPRGEVPQLLSRYPFSFLYDGRPSDELLDDWTREDARTSLADGRERVDTAWTDPATGLRVTWQVTAGPDFPAAEWLLCFENTGPSDTPIVENIRALDLAVGGPLSNDSPYILHSCRGGTPDPQQFEPATAVVGPGRPADLGSGSGRSSTRNLPFLTLECGRGAMVAAVGWSGCWTATVEAARLGSARITAGMERTHFLLHPGEKVRSPRILALFYEGNHSDAVLEGQALFRQLIYRHYTPTRDGKVPLPTLFCNTCFTRGGGWLNECNAENQISLIRAYGGLGIEALITDAGWFEGGWPAGAGNWAPRKDAYPDGMGPVAAAAKEEGTVYGLWFEPERVVAGTWIHRNHPEWLLSARDGENGTYLLNFGLPEVRRYFLDIVGGFMDLPGFRAYRQDCNMDPLPYWRHTDAPDRQGITEIRYLEGLYSYWDRIRELWPDAVVEGCASGGHRIDLESVMRMHFHQKTDYWFDDEVDQAALWSVGRYLPNNTFVAHVNRLDEYSYRSTMASSLCLGWIADGPDFDMGTAKRFVDEFRALRHLLVGASYPLLPYTRSHRDWIATQYHRPDLGEGMILAFRRAESPYIPVEVALRGLDPAATYELRYLSAGTTERGTGEALMRGLVLTLPEPRASEVVWYNAVGR